MKWRERATRNVQIWDSCAKEYEESIVCGHPEIVRYEAFENDLVDSILFHVIKLRMRKITLIDLGCGSGRFHVRYGAKTTHPDNVPTADRQALCRLQSGRPDLQYDSLLDRHLQAVFGVDFSEAMLRLAAEKLCCESGLGTVLENRLFLDRGLAQEFIPAFPVDYPVVICMINTIGIFQGVEGAIALLRHIRDLVEPHGGIGIISALRQERINPYALCNYESTMNVSGQPKWLEAENGKIYGKGYDIRPERHKLSLFNESYVDACVYDAQGRVVEERLRFHRIPEKVRYVQETGHIHTYSDYYSKWYSREELCEMCDLEWGGAHQWVPAERVDRLRGQMGQIVLLGDPDIARLVCMKGGSAS
ncbi:MAG: class I SAM-dependent methyltransferase [Armatimonadetes bacterium]|nr:class I SAM-dependent methyltransferase [Armatimonadota bacterium]